MARVALTRSLPHGRGLRLIAAANPLEIGASYSRPPVAGAAVRVHAAAVVGMDRGRRGPRALAVRVDAGAGVRMDRGRRDARALAVRVHAGAVVGKEGLQPLPRPGEEPFVALLYDGRRL